MKDFELRRLSGLFKWVQCYQKDHSKWQKCNWEGLYWCHTQSVSVTLILVFYFCSIYNALPWGILPQLCLTLKPKCLCLPHREIIWTCPPMRDCGILEFFVWEMVSPCLLFTNMAQKFTLGGPKSQVAVASLFINMAGDIPCHTTCEMTVRKQN